MAIIHKGQILVSGSLEHVRDSSNARNDALEDIFLELTSAQLEH
jgi:ABC-type Na+ transport system ATPase subunit NatA